MKILVIFTLLLLTTQGQAQRLKQLFAPRVAPRLNKIIPVNPANIDIVRDKWGVPHIFAPTDREVAYGLAYAMAEDGFAAMQDLILAAKGRTGEYLRAFYLQPYKDGKYRTFIGDGYMMFIKYSKDKKYPYIETIHPYGTSEHAENPHYNDQMELFVNKKAKVMTLDKTEIYKNAEKIYSPQ